MELRVKKLFCDAKLPERANPTDSGADVFVHSFKKVFPEREVLEFLVLNPNERALIGTGLAATVGIGFEIQVRPRSGNALNKGLIVVNSPGTIDESYRGEICIIIANIGYEPKKLKVGDKIAQLVVNSIDLSDIVEVYDLDTTQRDKGGFGSTGD